MNIQSDSIRTTGPLLSRNPSQSVLFLGNNPKGALLAGLIIDNQHPLRRPSSVSSLSFLSITTQVDNNLRLEIANGR